MNYLDPPGGKPWALLVLCGASLILNAVLLVERSMAPDAPEVPEAPEQVAVAEIDTPPVAPEVEAPTTEAPDALTAPANDESIHLLSATVEHSLARTFQKAAGDHADVVSAVYSRLFFWDLDLRRDLQRGDEVTVAYTWDGELAHIPVATYRSGSLKQTLRAYRFHATGDNYASWWDETGREVPYRLVDSPLADFEQVTSLIKDRPKHRGMDFKVPIGAPVTTPRNATVLRTNWNTTYNGGCVELKYDDGTLARFLHLSEADVKPGQRVAAGSVIGATGNSGRSTAPHLHYELERNGQVIDPVEYHGVTRRDLADGDRGEFAAERERLDQLLRGGSA